MFHSGFFFSENKSLHLQKICQSAFMTDTNHIIEALNKAGLDPFTLGQLRPSRMHVNKVFKTNFAKSRIMGKTWVLETLKGFQCLEVKFSDVQGCGFDSMQAFSLAFEKEQSNKK